MPGAPGRYGDAGHRMGIRRFFRNRRIPFLAADGGPPFPFLAVLAGEWNFRKLLHGMMMRFSGGPDFVESKMQRSRVAVSLYTQISGHESIANKLPSNRQSIKRVGLLIFAARIKLFVNVQDRKS